MWYSILIPIQRYRCGTIVLSCLFFGGIWGVGTASATCGDYLHAANNMQIGHSHAIDLATLPPLIPRNSPVCFGPNCFRRDAMPAMPTGLVVTSINHDLLQSECIRVSGHNGISATVEPQADALFLIVMRGRVYRPPRSGWF